MTDISNRENVKVRGGSVNERYEGEQKWEEGGRDTVVAADQLWRYLHLTLTTVYKYIQGLETKNQGHQYWWLAWLKLRVIA